MKFYSFEKTQEQIKINRENTYS